MKYILFAFLLIFSLRVTAQKNSNAYLSAMMHQEEPGLSLVNSWGMGNHLGIGAGVDITSYNSELFVPVYIDLRIKHTFQHIYTPFVIGQFGKQLYRNKESISFINVDNQRVVIDEIGRYFFSGGIGFRVKLTEKVGMFVSYLYRHAEFGYHIKPYFDTDLYRGFQKTFHVVNLGVTL